MWADKIVLNSICYENYSIINEISYNLGKQAVVASIDVRKKNDEYVLYSDCGRKKQNIKEKYIWCIEIQNTECESIVFDMYRKCIFRETFIYLFF